MNPRTLLIFVVGVVVGVLTSLAVTSFIKPPSERYRDQIIQIGNGSPAIVRKDLATGEYFIMVLQYPGWQKFDEKPKAR